MVDGRVVAAVAAAAALGRLTVTWLRRRRPQARSPGPAQPRHRARLLPRGRPLPSGPSELSLVSYNILCQKYATGRRFPHVFAQHLDPEYRWERLQGELAAFGADLVALQEVTIDRWGELKGFMAALGYAAVVQARAAASGSDFMLALFYRPDRLRLAWSEERSRALLAALEVTAEGPARGQLVWLANLHLEGSPYRPNDRVSQLRSALQRLEAHIGGKEAAERADVIICGDFNSVSQDSPCWLLRRGRLERNHTDACCPQVPVTKETIAHPFALHEAYEAAGFRPPFTRKVPGSAAVLDFLWCSRHMWVEAVMKPLQQELRPLVEKACLPNRVHPSDHLPVGAVLRLSGPEAAGAAADAAAAGHLVVSAGAARAASLLDAASGSSGAGSPH